MGSLRKQHFRVNLSACLATYLGGVSCLMQMVLRLLCLRKALFLFPVLERLGNY